MKRSSVLISQGNFTGGSVYLSGFKHLLVPIIAAAVLIPAEIRIGNVPEIADMYVMTEILRRLGARAEYDEGTLILDCRPCCCRAIPRELSSLVHGSLYLIPTLLGRFGRVLLGSPGGCSFGGERPILHVMSVLKRFGAQISHNFDHVDAVAGKFVPVEIDVLDWSDDQDRLVGPLVSGVTKAAILSSLAADGTTVIRHPYRKAEICELLRFLRSAGYCICDDGDAVTISRGCSNPSVSFDLPPDAIEFVTYVACASHTGMPIRISPINEDSAYRLFRAELELLRQMGVGLHWQADSVTISSDRVLTSIDIEVDSEGIYSDSHPFFALMATHADRKSTIRDRIWRTRYGYVRNLVQLGAEIEVSSDSITIYPAPLCRSGQDLLAHDLRDAAVCCLSALTLQRTSVSGTEHLTRGYADLLTVLRGLGAHVSVGNSV